jgi:hypothetical protein
MPIQFVSSDIKPQPNSLVVCAGTITCTTVVQMGSGFMLFKNLFNKKTLWKDSLQGILDRFHNGKEVMPSYILVAAENGYLGAVATVPVKSTKGLGFEKFSNKIEQELAFIMQYKEAVRLAVFDAIKLNRPLFIQPLGIGVYGWEPEQAAGLFVEAIKEADPNSLVDIRIPLFDSKELSKDQRFKNEFIRLAPELVTLSSAKTLQIAIKPQANPINVLRAFRKIYEALYEGQTSFFKTPKKQLSYDQIASYVKENPDSRTATAWKLAQLHHADTSTSNQDLFKSIHQYTFDRSSCFSFFKQTKNFSAGYDANMLDIIDQASDDSRTGKIRNALMQPG